MWKTLIQTTNRQRQSISITNTIITTLLFFLTKTKMAAGKETIDELRHALLHAIDNEHKHEQLLRCQRSRLDRSSFQLSLYVFCCVNSWFYWIWFCRVGIEMPKIEIRFEHLAVEGDVHVGSRALPTLINSTINFIEVLMI